MNQLTLTLTPRELARREDVATAHAAAERTAEFRARHLATIWAALKVRDMTCCEIAKATGLEYISVSRRMSEGNGRFWIRTPEKRPGKTDRLAAVWMAINV